MVTIKLGELREVFTGMDEVMSKELPIKTAYWLGKLAKKITKEARDFEEARMKLVEKYVLRDEHMKPRIEDGKYQFANPAAYEADYRELADTDVEVDFTPITEAQLGDVKISPLAMMGLEKFLNIE